MTEQASLDLNPTQKQRDIYHLLQEKNRWEYRWENRLKLCTQRFGISKTLIESINKWLWKSKELTAVEKNCFYKMMLICFRDKEFLWKQNVREHPLCFICQSFENWEHLFCGCESLAKYLAKIGIKQIKDIFNNVTVVKVKATVSITMGSLNEEKCETVSNLAKLTEELNL